MMQVIVEQVVDGSVGGGGVFVARCDYRDVSLNWLNETTLEIAYPESAGIDSQESESVYFGRVVSVQFAPR